MEIHNDVITSEPVDAATLLILRDSLDSQVSGAPKDSAPAPGLEVFLIRRHVKSSVLGGVYVFPGGKIDPRDASPDWIKYLDMDVNTLKQRLNEPELSPDQALAIYVGAIRETFEECGVLFTKSNHQTDNALKDLDSSQGLLSVLDKHNLQLSPEDLVPFSRWITPKMASLMSKRFDTRFFLAKNPGLQVAKHDNFEASDSAWMSPRQALTRYWNKEIELAPPQIMSLANLSHFKSVDEALEAVRSRTPSLIRPQPYDEDGVRHLAYPGHPRHSEREPAMGGPRLLRFLNQRFEPLGGFEAYFENA